MESRQNSVSFTEIDYTNSTANNNMESDVTLVRAQGRRSLAGVTYWPPIDAQPGHYKFPPPTGSPESRIVRSTGSDFKNRSANAVLEVLLEEPRVNVRSRLRKSSRIGNESLDQRLDLGGSPTIRQNAQRIRLRSAKLIKLFESIAQADGIHFNMPGPSSVVCRLWP